ncbi:hypothetical protein H9L05_19750 [Hymenobacter qilianensis]|uniref:DinB family protein n=1 Tax=Hymenobacter qilianensis TaxID=1385715 RepID=A0A7H0GUX8_9BACT|nr:hypothetical protein [Hymenobacter qilianensis]QNP52094.1 hypothetical protein H9L05_19750 [Hymenobacter qilianensis]
MNHRLNLRFEQLERATNQLLAQVELLGERASTSPGPGQWSAVQVVHHLLVSETGINQYIDKKLAQTEDLEEAGVGAFCGPPCCECSCACLFCASPPLPSSKD